MTAVRQAYADFFCGNLAKLRKRCLLQQTCGADLRTPHCPSRQGAKLGIMSDGYVVCTPAARGEREGSLMRVNVPDAASLRRLFMFQKNWGCWMLTRSNLLLRCRIIRRRWNLPSAVANRWAARRRARSGLRPDGDSGDTVHLQKRLEPMGIGIADRTKINANIGNSAVTATSTPSWTSSTRSTSHADTDDSRPAATSTRFAGPSSTLLACPDRHGPDLSNARRVRGDRGNEGSIFSICASISASYGVDTLTIHCAARALMTSRVTGIVALSVLLIAGNG